MSEIYFLDEKTINQIAAGEVIDRPSSIIKELVENSIDAESSAITIEIEDGGLSYIRVTDNGVGMDAKNAKASFVRHATSKIKTANDLNDVLTLGFRGEALASISAVTRMEMITRAKDSIAGYQLINEGGKITREGEIGCPEGTTIIARDLFFNTPARLKFLKSSRIETSYISEMVAKLILANPDISFKYVNNGKVVYYSPGDGDLKNTAFSIYGMDIVNEILPMDVAEDALGISAYGLLGMPGLARKNRNHLSFFVNGRYIKSDLMTRALEDAYKPYLTVNRFPWAIVHMGITPNMIDVNVHPSKTEIRFKDDTLVKEFLVRSIGEVLNKNPYIPTIGMSSFDHGAGKDITPEKDRINIAEQMTAFPEKKSNDYELEIENKKDYHMPIHQNQGERMITPVKRPIHEPVNPGNDSSDKDLRDIPNNCMGDYQLDNNINKGIVPFKVVGRLFSTYIILEDGIHCFLMDQHAAHERLLFERYKEMLSKDKVLTQQILPAAIIEVTHREKLVISESMDIFDALGFDIEEFGSRSFAIRGVPMVLGSSDINSFFHGLLDEIGEFQDGHNYKLKMEDIIRMSCKKAVKAGDELSDMEVIALLNDIMGNKIPMTCPHGRPIMVTISKNELEKSFKRIQ